MPVAVRLMAAARDVPDSRARTHPTNPDRHPGPSGCAPFSARGADNSP